MTTFEFITSFGWIGLGFLALSFICYLTLSGRLKWVQYNSLLGNIGLQVTTSLGVKDLSADEILAFEGFVYRDLENIERGARLAFILLFLEKELLQAQYEDNVLNIELTEKGKKLHEAIMVECEKRLMMSPKAEIRWRAGEKKIVTKKEEMHSVKHKHVALTS